MKHRDSLYAIFENSKDWSIYRDHEKRRDAFNAGWDGALREAADRAVKWLRSPSEPYIPYATAPEHFSAQLRAAIYAGEVKK